MTKANKQSDCADPFNLATLFLESGYDWTDGQSEPLYTLRRWHEEYYAYQAGKYIKQADDSIVQRRHKCPQKR